MSQAFACKLDFKTVTNNVEEDTQGKISKVSDMVSGTLKYISFFFMFHIF